MYTYTRVVSGYSDRYNVRVILGQRRVKTASTKYNTYVLGFILMLSLFFTLPDLQGKMVGRVFSVFSAKAGMDLKIIIWTTTGEDATLQYS